VANILLIDDDDDLTAFLRRELAHARHAVTCLDRADPAPGLLARAAFDVVLLDNKMPGMSGIDFLKLRIAVPVILMTGFADSDTAIRAINLGAFEYVVKPSDFQSLVAELLRVISRAVAIKPPREVHVPGQSPAATGDGPKLVGNSKAMQEVYTRIGQFADLPDSVLILGETGTGKELVAAAFHSFSSRKDRPFVALNCTAITETLLESELFGHERGAFTGADKVRKGMIEHANGGTLFLDEIGDMPPNLQAKLLRVLQERQLRRVGGTESIAVDFRLVSATHRDLEAAIEAGTFRRDLLYRLNRVKLRLPPLRERLDDLPALVSHFLLRSAAGRSHPAPAPATMERFRTYHWPGNVRELENVIAHAFGVCRGGTEILPAHLPADVFDRPAPATGAGEGEVVAALRKAITAAWDAGQKDLWPYLRDLLEAELLRVALERLKGNQTHIAERLNMARNTVIKRIEEYGLK
jgi:DNA-binding NtrC family response regulator